MRPSPQLRVSDVQHRMIFAIRPAVLCVMIPGRLSTGGGTRFHLEEAGLAEPCIPLQLMKLRHVCKNWSGVDGLVDDSVE